MNFVKQSVEEIKQEEFDIVSIKKHIEKCARVTYKSEDKITPDSHIKFVQKMISMDHSRPLEFGTVHLKASISNFHYLRDTLCINRIWNDWWIKYKYVGDITYITTNYRYYLDILKIYPDIEKFFTEEDSDFYPKRYTFKFITDRGIMDDLRTHVSLSHLGESTRWINYNKDKFGHELTFIDFDASPGEMESLAPVFQYTEDEYMLNVGNDLQAQQARRGLPLGIKSELISCGFEDAWRNFIYRRADKAAHPMAQELANKLKQWFS